MKYLLGAVGSACLLCQCTSFHLGRAEGIDPNPFSVLEKQATAENRDASRIVVPVLKSKDLEKRWGSPTLLVGPNGGYALRYENPARAGQHVTVFGSAKRYSTAGLIPPPYTEIRIDRETGSVEPAEVSQSWRSLSISGRSVRYYISEGATGEQYDQYSTETFRLTAADGRTASYRIRCAARSDEEAAGLMGRLSL